MFIINTINRSILAKESRLSSNSKIHGEGKFLYVNNLCHKSIPFPREERRRFIHVISSNGAGVDCFADQRRTVRSGDDRCNGRNSVLPVYSRHASIAGLPPHFLNALSAAMDFPSHRSNALALTGDFTLHFSTALASTGDFPPRFSNAHASIENSLLHFLNTLTVAEDFTSHVFDLLAVATADLPWRSECRPKLRISCHTSQNSVRASGFYAEYFEIMSEISDFINIVLFVKSETPDLINKRLFIKSDPPYLMNQRKSMFSEIPATIFRRVDMFAGIPYLLNKNALFIS
jgi:hypothetical protein